MRKMNGGADVIVPCLIYTGLSFKQEAAMYYLLAKCGTHMLRMEDVDRVALEYLRELLSEDNQRTIADAMRKYQAEEDSRMEEFKAALKKRSREKQRQYDALLKNLSSGELPAEVVADIGAQMKELGDSGPGSCRAAERLHCGADKGMAGGHQSRAGRSGGAPVD